jgi:mRNA interferase RelE/StbE
MGMKQWNVIVLPIAEKQLGTIKDQRAQKMLRASLKGLERDPEKQGKCLGHELAGYRSIRAVGQRYRVIYRVEEERVLVVVVTVGIRRVGDKKDVYEVAKKLARLGLFDLEDLE